MTKFDGPDLDWIADLVRRHSMMEAVLVPAFVDLDTSPRRVKLFPRCVFIGSGSGYLVLRIDESSGQMQLADGQTLEIPEALEGEPSIEPVLADLSLNYLDEARPLRCSGISLYLDADSSAPENRFRAVGFRFGENRTLFFDPFWPSGIRIGDDFEAARLRDEIHDGGIAELTI